MTESRVHLPKIKLELVQFGKYSNEEEDEQENKNQKNTKENEGTEGGDDPDNNQKDKNKIQKVPCQNLDYYLLVYRIPPIP